MSAARALGAIYLAIASVFGVAIALQQHPHWQQAANKAGVSLTRFADAHLMRPATEFGRRQMVALYQRIIPPSLQMATKRPGATTPQVAVAKRRPPAAGVGLLRAWSPPLARTASISSPARAAPTLAPPPLVSPAPSAQP